MKPCTIIFALLLSFLTPFSPAHADDYVTAINITADYYPGNQYAVGFDLDSNNLITQVYFQDQNGNKTFYSLDELNSFQPLFEIAGIKVVQMRIASHVGNNQATIQLQYTTDSLTGSTQTLTFQVNYNTGTQAYDIIDNRTNQVIHNANATTNYGFLHIPIGISGITTS